MADPQDPNPSFWRRLAELGGVDDEIDAVTGAARSAGNWIQSQLPEQTAAGKARQDGINRQIRGAQAERSQGAWDAVAGPVKRFFGSETVQKTGQQMKEAYSPYWTPTPETAAWAERTKQGITERSNAARALLPKAPVTVQGHGALRGLSADVDPLKPIDWLMKGQNELVPNFAVDQAADATTPVGGVMNLDLPVGPAVHAAAPLLAKAGGAAAHFAGVLPPGFYSRVDKIAEQVGKKGVTPQRLAAMLKGSTHPDEVAYRKLNELIASKGNQLITKAELTEHLAQHPPPGLGQKILGAKDPDDLTAYVSQPKYGPSSHPTLNVPGGSNYREALSTLEHPRPSIEKAQEELTAIEEQLAAQVNSDNWLAGGALSDENKALMARANALYAKIGALERTGPKPYEGSHHGVANQFAHVRYDQRDLPGRGPGRFLQEVQSDWEHAGREHGYAPPDADRQYQDAINGVDNALDAQSRYEDDFRQRYEVDRPFVETPYDQWQQEEITPEYHNHPGNQRIYFEDMERRRREHSYTALRDAMEEDPGFQQHRAAVRAADQRLTAARSQSRSGVPELPFKNVWDEVALKQQLTDIAHNHPDTQWLGLTSGETQAKRYDLSKHLSKLEYNPESHRLTGYDRSAPNSIIVDEDVAPEDLHKYIGKDRADQLRTKSEQHARQQAWERTQWGVEQDPDSGRYHVMDPNGDPLYTYDGALEHYGSAGEAQSRIDELLRDEQMQHGGRDLPTLEGDDLSFGGLWTRQLYDNMLRRRIEKVLQPHGGGKMEPFGLPTGGVEPPVPRGHYITHEAAPGEVAFDGFTTQEEAEDFLRDLGSPEHGGNIPPGFQVHAHAPGGGPETEPSWITQLSPDVLQSIRDKGFDLMSLVPPALLGGAAAAQAAGDDDQAGGGGAGMGLAAMLPFVPGMRRPGLNKTSRAAVEEARRYLQHASLTGPIARKELEEILKEAPLWMHSHRVTKDLPVEPALGEASKILTPGGGSGVSAYDFSPGATARLHGMADIGAALPFQANWGNALDPEMLPAFNHDRGAAELFGRFFGAMSPRTSVPKNSLEAITFWNDFLRNPGRKPTDARLRELGAGNVASKTDNLIRAIYGDDPSGEKVDLFTDYMAGHANLPVPDVHGLYAIGSQHGSVDSVIPELRQLVQQYEGIPAVRGGLSKKDYVRRLVDSFGRSLQSYDPQKPMGPLFGSTWEGTRAQKGLGPQGGMIDIYRSRGLTEPGAMLDPRELGRAIREWRMK